MSKLSNAFAEAGSMRVNHYCGIIGFCGADYITVSCESSILLGQKARRWLIQRLADDRNSNDRFILMLSLNTSTVTSHWQGLVLWTMLIINRFFFFITRRCVFNTHEGSLQCQCFTTVFQHKLCGSPPPFVCQRDQMQS